MLTKEVEREARLSAMTIYRMQNNGLFPRYHKLSPKKNALFRTVFEEWKRDPQGWAKRNSEAVA
jgi:predicted DNA-binding transcriptional regulator AlpA